MIKLPQFKGHAKIYTKNKKGEITKFYEGDNIVTNAVRDIVANDYLGALDPNLITPLWKKWYGGIMLYQYQHPDLDPDNYFMQDPIGNPSCAHAGHENTSNLSKDNTRGFYNTAKEVKTANSVTQCWEWGPDAGSMEINAVSLCNENLGNYGMTYAAVENGIYKTFCPFEILSNRIPNFTSGCNAVDNINFMVDDVTGGWFVIGQPGEFYNMHSKFETRYVTIYLKKLALRKVGLITTQNVDSQYDNSFTIDLGDNVYCNPSFMYENGILTLFSNITGTGPSSESNLTWSNTTMKWWQINVLTKTLEDSGSWPYFSNLGPVCIEGSGDTESYAPMYLGTRCMNPNVPRMTFLGSDLVFFPICENPAATGATPYFDVTAWASISLTSGYPHAQVSMQESKQFEFTSFMGAPFGTPGNSHPIITPEKIAFSMSGWDCNPDKFWVDNRHVYITGATQYNFITPTKPSSYVIPQACGNASTQIRSFVANKFLDTTKLNLPSQFTKSNDETMCIEYTLTEI